MKRVSCFLTYQNKQMLEKILESNKNIYDNKSHVMRVAIVKLYRRWKNEESKRIY